MHFNLFFQCVEIDQIEIVMLICFQFFDVLLDLIVKIDCQTVEYVLL